MNNSGLSYNSTGTVSGVFFTKKDADAAYNGLLKRGHTPDDISVLMSDETLDKHQKQGYEQANDESTKVVEPAGDSLLDKTKTAITETIISITAMISLPGLGIAISNTLFKKIAINPQEGELANGTVSAVIGSRIPEEHTDSYGGSVKEGGIIISVDPRNEDEKRAIVLDFKKHNGHDILGDDGYTELD